MGRAYSDITFTPTVRDTQEEMGSRAQYAFLDTVPDRGDALTPREAQFIAEADHFFQATVSETGWPYVQHRGGPKGFLKVLNPKTIGFADFRGNLMYLSVGNLRRDDRISLILVDFPNRRRLKLLGRVQLVEAGESPEADAAIAALGDPGYPADVERAFLIAVEAWDWNCPQHITPRFTEAEVATLMAPMRAQVQKLKTQLAEAKAAGAAGAPPAAAPGPALAFGDGPLSLTVAGVRQLTGRVRAYELVRTDGGPLPIVDAGAHLEVPMRLADGTTTTRSYSIASESARRDAFEIAVLREAEGLGGSAAVHQDFAIGTRLQCSMPSNNFPLAVAPHRAVLVAGGIGITPIKAMAHALAARGADFELHFACRSRADAPYLGQLEERFGERVVVHADNEAQRLDVTALIGALGMSDHLYVCGPAGLIDAVTSGAAGAGIPAERVHFERFVAARATDGDAPFIVHLIKSGRRIEVPPGRSILDSLEANGLRPASSCRIGTCGTCATRVTAGTPLHRDEVLTPAQRDTDHLMCICVSRAASAELSLDL